MGVFMDIEIIEFFPRVNVDPKCTFIGTLHIRILELDIEIKGCPVIKTKKHMFIRLPTKIGTCRETGNDVFYPIISFVDREKTNQLRELLMTKGVEYMKTLPLTSSG